MMTFLPVQYDAVALSTYAELFSRCFPKSAGFTVEYLDWLYCKNPDGVAIGFDAWDGDRLAAHYVCVPAKIFVSGRPASAMLSLNTATHPEYQGKGLFTKLAQLTYAAGTSAGLDCVFGVANANSTGGFVRKLGFQLVEPLDARIGVGSLGVDWGVVGRNVQFARRWTPEALAWRCANPRHLVFCKEKENEIQFHTAAKGIFLSAYAELHLDEASAFATSSRGFLSPLHLFIGLIPTGACRFHGYVSIPRRFRPSPLNFIYRSLNSPMTNLEKGRINFSFLDFDAY